jgi:hypothetical protein
MEEKVSSARIALKYGVLTGLAIIVYTAIINVAGLSQNKALTSLTFVMMIVGLVIGMKAFREKNHGYMSYGEGLGVGTQEAVIMGLLGSAFSMFYLKFIDPTLLTQSLNQVRTELEAKGLDDSQIETALETSQKFMTPGFIFGMGVFGYLIVGFIASLIIAAIIRKEKPVFD